jgi:hypothetical protein
MLTLRCAITQVVCLFALLSQNAWIRCKKCEKGAKEAEEEQLHCLKCSHTECRMLCPGLSLEARRGSEDYCLNQSQSFDVLVMLISGACRLCTKMFWPHSQNCPLAAGGPMLVLNAPQVGALHIIAVAQAIGIVNHLCLHATNFRQLRDHCYIKSISLLQISQSPRLVLKFPLCCTTAFRTKTVNFLSQRCSAALLTQAFLDWIAIVPEFLQQPRSFPSGSN